MEDAEKKREVEALLRRFSRGILQGDYRETYRAHKAIYRLGRAAIPFLKDMVLRSDFSHPKYPAATRYAAGLVTLIRDIDEDEAKSVARQLVNKGCTRPLELALDSICTFSLVDYVAYMVRGIRVLQRRDLGTRCDVRAWLVRWLDNVPERNLEDLVQIHVVRREDIEGAAAGTYTPYLHKITVLWDAPDESLGSRILLLFVEATLYHEIGHHVCRHDFGQDPVQEREADAYAYRLLKKAHPRLAWLLKTLRVGRRREVQRKAEDSC